MCHVFPFGHPNTIQTSHDPNEAQRILQNGFSVMLLSNPVVTPDCRTEVGPSSGILPLLPLPRLAGDPTLVKPGHTLSGHFSDRFCCPALFSLSLGLCRQLAQPCLPTDLTSTSQNGPVPPETDPRTRASTGWEGAGINSHGHREP